MARTPASPLHPNRKAPSTSGRTILVGPQFCALTAAPRCAPSSSTVPAGPRPAGVRRRDTPSVVARASTTSSARAEAAGRDVAERHQERPPRRPLAGAVPPSSSRGHRTAAARSSARGARAAARMQRPAKATLRSCERRSRPATFSAIIPTQAPACAEAAMAAARSRSPRSSSRQSPRSCDNRIVVSGSRDHAAEHWQTLLEQGSPNARGVPRMEGGQAVVRAGARARRRTGSLIDGTASSSAHSAGADDYVDGHNGPAADQGRVAARSYSERRCRRRIPRRTDAHRQRAGCSTLAPRACPSRALSSPSPTIRSRATSVSEQLAAARAARLAASAPSGTSTRRRATVRGRRRKRFLDRGLDRSAP